MVYFEHLIYKYAKHTENKYTIYSIQLFVLHLGLKGSRTASRVGLMEQISPPPPLQPTQPAPRASENPHEQHGEQSEGFYSWAMEQATTVSFFANESAVSTDRPLDPSHLWIQPNIYLFTKTSIPMLGKQL